LTGIHSPFEVEARGDFVAIYVPDAGMDGMRLYWGATLLKALMLYEHRSGVQIRSDAIQSAFDRLRADFTELEEASRQVGKFRESIRRAQKKVNEAMDGLVDQAIAAEVRLKQVVDQLRSRLLEELHDLPRTTDDLALPAPTPPDEIEAFLTELDASKDKRGPAFRALYVGLKEADVAISLEEGHWTFARGGKIVAKTSGTKTRLDVHWLLEDGEEQSFLVGLETVKKNRIVISNPDAAKVVDRVLNRLA
jgi:hypothetical protein